MKAGRTSKLTAVLFLTLFLLSAKAVSAAELPPAEPNPHNVFGIDLHVNTNTVDDYLGREDTVYIDLRMVSDPAEYEAIGGESDLDRAIAGFRCVPYPFLATLQDLPVPGAYHGRSLYTVLWNEDGTPASVTPNYAESEQVIDDLFPKDKNIFLCCGGGGYSGMMRAVLISLGRNPDRIYNVGAVWAYEGKNIVDLVERPQNGEPFVATWRIDYAFIDFSMMHPLAP